MCSKKDYERAAKQVKAMHADRTPVVYNAVMMAFVYFFKADNPAFDAGRFIFACEPK
jgi:hypothetical protein